MSTKSSKDFIKVSTADAAVISYVGHQNKTENPGAHGLRGTGSDVTAGGAEAWVVWLHALLFMHLEIFNTLE